MVSLLALLAGLVPAGERLDRHPWTEATEAHDDYFVVETNTFPEIADSLAAQLRVAHAFFEDRFGPLRGKARRPMRVALFRTEKEYLELGDGVRGAVGHFDAALDRCAIVWRGHTGERGWPVAVHEATHHYLRRRHPDAAPPSWYGEGIACYFEGLLDPTTERNVARLRLHTAKAAVRNGDARLELLLRTRARVSGGRLLLQNFAPTRYYGLAWSFVHFLASDPRYRDRFRRFELRLFASRPRPNRREVLAQRLLEEECGPLAALEREWHAHVRALPVPKRATPAAVYAWELAADRPFVRYAALRRLEDTALPARLRPAFVRCLRDGDLIVRTEAVRLARANMNADAAGPLVRALDLGDPALKTAALEALAHPTARAAVPRLLRETRDRPAALRALAAIGDPRAFPALRAALLDALVPTAVRVRCAAALAVDPAALPALRSAGRDGDRMVRTAANAAGAKLEERLHVEPEKPAPPAPLSAEQAKKLLALARSPTAAIELRCRACAALGTARTESAVPALRRLCRPAVPDRVRLAAVRALVEITGEARGFAPGQSAREREEAYGNWMRE